METTTQIGHLRLRQLSPKNVTENENAAEKNDQEPSLLPNTKNFNTLPRIEVIFYRSKENPNLKLDLAFDNMSNCVPMTDTDISEAEGDFVKVLEKANFCVQNVIMHETKMENTTHQNDYNDVEGAGAGACAQGEHDANDYDAEINRNNIVQQLMELNSSTRKFPKIISVLNDENPMKALAKILITPEFITNTPQLQVKLLLRKVISLGRLCMRNDNLISVRVNKNAPTIDGEILDLANLITTGTLVKHNKDEFITFCSCKRCLPYRQIVYHIMMEHFHVSHMVDSLLEVLVKAYYRMFKNKTSYHYFDHYMSSNRHVYWLATGFSHNKRMDHMHFVYDKSITDNMIFVLFSTILLVNNPMLLLQILSYHIKCVLKAYCEGAVETNVPGDPPNNSQVNAEKLLNYVLDGYQEMGTISDGISTYFFTLEKVFLSKFNLTWRFLCERLYYQHVYAKLASKMEACIALLITKSLDEQFLELNVKFLAFENEMLNIKMKWSSIWLKMHHFNLSETECKRRRGFSDIHNTMSTMVEDAIVMEIPENKDERQFYEFLMAADPIKAWQTVLAFTKTKWPNGFYKPPNVIECEDKCIKCRKLLNYHQQSCNCITCAIGGGPEIPKHCKEQFCQGCSFKEIKLDTDDLKLCDLKASEDFSEIEKHAYTVHDMRGEIPYHCAWILFKHLKYRKPYILPTLMDKFFCENCSQIPCRLARYIMTNKFSKDLSKFLIDFYQPISMSREELRALLPNIMRYNYRMIRTNDDNDLADACNNLVVKTYWTFLLSIYATYFIDTREEIPLDISSLYLKKKDVHFNLDRLLGNRSDRRFDTFLHKLTLPKIPFPKSRSFDYAAYFESSELQQKIDDIMKMSLYEMNSRTELELHLKEGTSKLRKASGNNVAFTSIDVHQVLPNLNVDADQSTDLPQAMPPKFTPSERAIIQRELADNCKDFTGKKRLKKKSIKEFSQVRVTETRDRLRKKLSQLENSKKRPLTPTTEMSAALAKASPITMQPTGTNEILCRELNSSPCNIPPQRPVTPQGLQQPPSLKEAAAAASQIDQLMTEVMNGTATTITTTKETGEFKNNMKELVNRMAMLGQINEKPLLLKKEITTTTPIIPPATATITTTTTSVSSKTKIILNKGSIHKINSSNNNSINKSNSNNMNTNSNNKSKDRSIKNRLKTINVCSALMSNNNFGHKCDCYLRGDPRALSPSSSLSSLTSSSSSYSPAGSASSSRSSSISAPVQTAAASASASGSTSDVLICKRGVQSINAPDVIKNATLGAAAYDKWINDTLNFIEGSNDNENQSQRKMDPKKAAKKAKQKLKKEEGKRISELQDLRDQFHDIFYKEYADKEHLKKLKHNNDNNKIRDKKIIQELEVNVKKLHAAKAKLEQNILELIATVKQTSGEFKFAYLPTREQLLNKMKEQEKQHILLEEQMQQQPRITPPIIDSNKKIKLINPAFLAAGMPPISGDAAPAKAVLPYAAMNLTAQMIYAPPPVPQQHQHQQQQTLLNLPPMPANNNGQVSADGGDPGNRIVTIRRVAVPNAQEPQVSITRKGAPPSAEDLVYTIVHGQFMPTQNLHQHQNRNLHQQLRHECEQQQQRQQQQQNQYNERQEEPRLKLEERQEILLDALRKKKESIDDGKLSRTQLKKLRKRLIKEHAKAAVEIQELEKQLLLQREEHQKEKELLLKADEQEKEKLKLINKNKKKNQPSEEIKEAATTTTATTTTTISSKSTSTSTSTSNESGSVSPAMPTKSTNCTRDNSVNSNNTLSKVLSRKQLKQQQKQLRKAAQNEKLKQEEEKEKEIQLNAQIEKDNKNKKINKKKNEIENNKNEKKVKKHAAIATSAPVAAQKEKKLKIRTKRSVVIDNGQFDNNPYKFLHTNETDDFSSESEESDILEQEEEEDVDVIEEQQKQAQILEEKISQNTKMKEKQNKKSNKKDLKTTSATVATITTTHINKKVPNELKEKVVGTKQNTNSINTNNKNKEDKCNNTNNNFIINNSTKKTNPPENPEQPTVKNKKNNKNKNIVGGSQSQNTVSTANTTATATKQKNKRKDKVPQQQEAQSITEEVAVVAAIPASKAEIKKKRAEEKNKIQNEVPYALTTNSGAVNSIYGNKEDAVYYEAQAAAAQRQQQQQLQQNYNQLAQQMQQLRLGNAGHTYDNNNTNIYAPMTAGAATMSNNASIMDQLSRGVQVENLSLPPGITLTKVDPIKSEQLRRKSETIKKLSQPLTTQVPVAAGVAASQHGVWNQHPSATIIAPPVSTYMGNTSPYIIPSNPCVYNNNNGIIMVESPHVAANQQILQQQQQPAIISAAPTGTTKKTGKKSKTNTMTSAPPIDERANLKENSSKLKKNRKRRNKLLKPELPLAAAASNVESTEQPKMITLRNPMFHGNAPAATASATAVPVGQPQQASAASAYMPAGNPLMGLMPQALPIDQPAAIIKNENGMFTIRNPALHQAVSNGLAMSGYRQFGNVSYYTPQEAASMAEAVPTSTITQTKAGVTPNVANAGAGAQSSPFSYFFKNTADDANPAKETNNIHNNISISCTSIDANAQVHHDMSSSMDANIQPKHLSAIGSEMKSAQQQKQKTLDTGAASSSWMPRYLSGVNSSNYYNGLNAFVGGNNSMTNSGDMQSSCNNNNNNNNSNLFADMPKSNDCSMTHHSCGDDSPPPTITGFTSSYLDGIPNTGVIRYDDASFLKNLIPGRNLNNEVSIHNINEANYNRNASPATPHVELTPVYGRSSSTNLYEQTQSQHQQQQHPQQQPLLLDGRHDQQALRNNSSNFADTLSTSFDPVSAFGAGSLLHGNAEGCSNLDGSGGLGLSGLFSNKAKKSAVNTPDNLQRTSTTTPYLFEGNTHQNTTINSNGWW